MRVEERDTTQVKQLGTGGRLVGWSVLVAGLIALQYASRLSEGKPDPNVLYRYSTAAGSAVVYAILLGLVLLITGIAARASRATPSAIVAAGARPRRAAADRCVHRDRITRSDPARRPRAGPHAQELAAEPRRRIRRQLRRDRRRRADRRGAHLPRARLLAARSVSEPGRRSSRSASPSRSPTGSSRHSPSWRIFGCALAWLRSKTNSVYPGMLLHGTFNSISLIAAVTATHH